jgi:hypothetical protein
MRGAPQASKAAAQRFRICTLRSKPLTASARATRSDIWAFASAGSSTSMAAARTAPECCQMVQAKIGDQALPCTLTSNMTVSQRWCSTQVGASSVHSARKTSKL